MKSIIIKQSQKQEREEQVLLGLVECYIRSARPVGSASLKEAGFENLSSATIRNYFSQLEKKGFLVQQHTSGGRIPTAKAYKLYAQNAEELVKKEKNIDCNAQSLLKNNEQPISSLLQQGAETLAAEANLPLFLSAPRFDQDYIKALKLVPIESLRYLCVIITDFGVVRTEQLYTEEKINALAVRRIEAYFNWRLTGYERPENLSVSEEALAQSLYNEVMVRYLVNYTHFIDDEIYRTGLSYLLSYQEMQRPELVGQSLAFFENLQSMQLMIRESLKTEKLKVWIEDDLAPYCPAAPPCAVLAIPYCIFQQPVGVIGLLGPMRMPYKRVFALLKCYAEVISQALTQAVYKYKITFRKPQVPWGQLENNQHRLLLEHLGSSSRFEKGSAAVDSGSHCKTNSKEQKK